MLPIQCEIPRCSVVEILSPEFWFAGLGGTEMIIELCSNNKNCFSVLHLEQGPGQNIYILGRGREQQLEPLDEMVPETNPPKPLSPGEHSYLL